MLETLGDEEEEEEEEEVHEKNESEDEEEEDEVIDLLARAGEDEEEEGSVLVWVRRRLIAFIRLAATTISENKFTTPKTMDRMDSLLPILRVICSSVSNKWITFSNEPNEPISFFAFFCFFLLSKSEDSFCTSCHVSVTSNDR